MQIQIDSEFKSLIPPLSNEELAQLEANILADGCRDPLVAWDGVLIDGHNRYEICSRHNLPYQVVSREFESREAVLDWIDLNQLGRRNLSPDQASLLRGRVYNRRKKSHGGDRKSEESRDQNDPLIEKQSTAETLGNQFGVSAPTIKRDGQFAASVEAIKPYVPDIESRISTGEISKRDVVEAAKEPEKAPEIIHNHRAQGTGENEWYTPPEFIESVRSVMGGIDLDPATSAVAQERIGAKTIFTVEDDGLTQDWFGRVWLNPPYSQPAIQQFIEKVCAEVDCGRVSQAIVLTHNYTDTRWFHAAVASASAICFTRGRIGFLSPEGRRAAPTQGQAFFYFGDRADLFVAEFSKHGFVVEIASPCIARAAA